MRLGWKWISPMWGSSHRLDMLLFRSSLNSMEYWDSHVLSGLGRVHPNSKRFHLFDSSPLLGEATTTGIVLDDKDQLKLNFMDGSDDCFKVVEEVDICHLAKVLWQKRWQPLLFCYRGLPYLLAFVVHPACGPEDNQYGFHLEILIAIGIKFALAPLFFDSLYTRLDEFVGNFT